MITTSKFMVAVILTGMCLLAQDNPRQIPPQNATVTGAHVGASPFNPPETRDNVFVLDTGSAGLDTGCTFRRGGPLIIKVPVNRVVGDVDATGRLVDPAALIANGIISKFATVRMPAFDVDYDAVLAPPGQPERDIVRVNGINIGPANSVAYLTGGNNVWKLNEFQIPIETLRFGKRTPGAAATPNDNEIRIDIDQANIPNGNEYWCTAIDWVSINFDALSPVIMVHGNNSNGAFFSDFNYIGPFQTQKIPFDNSINMVTNSVAVHSALLATLIPARAAEFGAKRIHIVAHSKGGLDTRDFLARTIPPNLGVLSFTTLSTPHRGSVGADYSIDAVTANSLFSDDTTRTKLAQQAPPDLGTPNLRTSFLVGFNAANVPLLPANMTVDGETKPVSYFSFSADANLDGSVSIFGNPTIQHNETRGTSQPATGVTSNNTVWATALEQVYRLLGTVASTTLAPRTIGICPACTTVMVVRETPTTSFQLNDFLVTLGSARLAPFRELASLRDNHATMANPGSAATTISAIKSIQPIR